MLILMYRNDEDNFVGFTQGCGCCQEELNDKDRIMEELKKTYQFLKESCESLNVTFDDLKES